MGNREPATPEHAKRILGLAQYPQQVKQAIMLAQGDGEMVDVLGTVNSVERHVGDQRRRAAAELEPGIEGDFWEFGQGRIAKRSYNTTSLLNKFIRARDESLLGVIIWLIDNDILRVSWQWKKLQAAVNRYDISLSIAKHEIQDGDVKHDIGEVWGWGSPKYESTALELED